jgi:hypothetical protein
MGWDRGSRMALSTEAFDLRLQPSGSRPLISGFAAATAGTGASGVTGRIAAACRISRTRHGGRCGSGQGRVGGHELFEMVTAACFTMDRHGLVKHEHFSHVTAIGAQIVEQWHAILH